jgi:hypothetical protein
MATIGHETERERARRYRQRARESRTEATNTGATARHGLIQFALLCEILADSIEAQLAEDGRNNAGRLA